MFPKMAHVLQKLVKSKMNGLKYKSSGISDFTAITIWRHKTLFFEKKFRYMTRAKSWQFIAVNHGCLPKLSLEIEGSFFRAAATTAVSTQKNSRLWLRSGELGGGGLSSEN